MRARAGFALLYALFMVMALSLVGLGIMALGVRESAIAGVLERHAAAHAGVEAAALRVLARWSTRSYSTLSIGLRRELPGDSAFPAAAAGAAAAAVVRLDTTLYLVTAEAASTGRAGVRARAGMLVRTLSPASLTTTFPAALTATASVEVRGGSVRGESSCDSGAPGGAVPGIIAPRVAVGPGVDVSGEPPALEAPAPLPAEPDPFSPELTPVLADLVYPLTSAVPMPGTALGRCEITPENWGAVEPDHPCHTLLPFIHVPGSISIVGGEGRGLLVVDGDAHLTDGARFHGIVLVRGTLVLDGRSRIAGAARSDTAFILDGDVLRDDCAIEASLSAPALDQAFRPPGRWWVPLF